MPIPPKIRVILDRALEEFGPLQLSVLSPNVPNLEALDLLEQTEDIKNETLSQNR